MPSTLVTIPARKGKAARLSRGERVKVVNTHGAQVVDTWAFNAADASEFMSMEHTRGQILKLMPAVGDGMYTNRRREILRLVEDTSPGIHDTLMAACNRERYENLGCREYHDNCQDNMFAALADLGFEAPEVPSPWNLFMNIPWTQVGRLSWAAPESRPGDYLLLEACMDLVLVFSACPQDMLPINGQDMQPTEAHFQVIAP